HAGGRIRADAREDRAAADLDPRRALRQGRAGRRRHPLLDRAPDPRSPVTKSAERPSWAAPPLLTCARPASAPDRLAQIDLVGVGERARAGADAGADQRTRNDADAAERKTHQRAAARPDAGAAGDAIVGPRAAS